MIHSANEEYEWRALLGMIMCGFVVITMSMTIFPIMEDANKILIHETKLRAIQFASTISRTNAQALKDKNLDRIDTTFLEREEGVASYELFDLEGRIFRPISKQNDYVSDTFSVRAREWAFKQENLGEQPLAGALDAGEIGVAQKIMSYDVKTGSYEGVGVIAIRFRPTSLAVQASKNAKAYLEALATSAIVAIIFFGFIYYLSLRPLEEMRYQIEEALRGKRKNLESKYLMGELSNLRTSINSLLQRVRELQSKGEVAEFEEVESDAQYVETLQQFMLGAGVPVIILDSQKNVKKINATAEDLCGIREVSSVDKSFLDVAREKGFAATVTELCDISAGENAVSKQGEYELAGNNYNIYVKALLGKDSFAKAFYITFIKQ